MTTAVSSRHGERNLSYHRPVLMGFRGVANRHYNIDPEGLVTTHGHRLIAGEEEPRDLFVRIAQTAVERA